MKTSQKIEKWARIGQIAYLLYLVFSTIFEMQLPMHEATVFTVLAVIIFFLAFLFSEAIVRVIGYFAELLDK